MADPRNSRNLTLLSWQVVSSLASLYPSQHRKQHRGWAYIRVVENEILKKSLSPPPPFSKALDRPLATWANWSLLPVHIWQPMDSSFILTSIPPPLILWSLSFALSRAWITNFWTGQPPQPRARTMRILLIRGNEYIKRQCSLYLLIPLSWARGFLLLSCCRRPFLILRLSFWFFCTDGSHNQEGMGRLTL